MIQYLLKSVVTMNCFIVCQIPSLESNEGTVFLDLKIHISVKMLLLYTKPWIYIIQCLLYHIYLEKDF